jgi:hypothetical protein
MIPKTQRMQINHVPGEMDVIYFPISEGVAAELQVMFMLERKMHVSNDAYSHCSSKERSRPPTPNSLIGLTGAKDANRARFTVTPHPYISRFVSAMNRVSVTSQSASSSSNVDEQTTCLAAPRQ